MKHCFLITSYCDKDLKKEILIESIDNLRSISDNDICLHAHYPLNEDIQNKVNYYLYDASNPVLKYPEKHIIWWKKCGDIEMHINKPDYGYAVMQQWKRGFNFLQKLYDNIIILNYDVIIDKDLLKRIESKEEYEACNFLQENLNTMSTILSINTKSTIFNKITLENYKEVDVIAEDFAKHIFSDTNTYRFKFDEYKEHYYTMLDFDGNSKFKENNLKEHVTPYDSMEFENFKLFIGERNGKLVVFLFDVIMDLYVKILYNNMMFDTLIKTKTKLINTNISFNQFDANQLFLEINNENVEIDRDIISICKML